MWHIKVYKMVPRSMCEVKLGFLLRIILLHTFISIYLDSKQDEKGQAIHLSADAG